ncbi:hypothetical protein CA13_08700 [Planctomycetes bacterium CA13]|uniref:Transposase IS4-like domain-containing protein n=1 Tax=Novipirellula herctigrandis TaxID=2527986 RepID=A0A5C5YWN8_9BACT|nr:hypothetical protein CA13_08700 [Planctomycetes bacterium CA13]
MRHFVFVAKAIDQRLSVLGFEPDCASELAVVVRAVDVEPFFDEISVSLDFGNDDRLAESTASGGYSRARSQLPLEVIRWFAQEVSSGVISATEPTMDGRRVFLIDGTTMALAPEKELQQAFPIASNQMGEGVWPCALLTVFHELASGAAMLPQVGPIYGPEAVSETQLARQGLEQLPPNSIIMSDAGYGIFGTTRRPLRQRPISTLGTAV